MKKFSVYGSLGLAEVMAFTITLIDPDDRGAILVEVDLNDRTNFQARYHQGEEKPDFETSDDVLNPEGLLAAVGQLRRGERENIITSTGSHDLVCTLEWRKAGRRRPCS